jgi:D-alanine-D-alanine ligase
MIKSKKHIEIVRSTTRGLSSMSQESCDSIFAVLSKHYAYVGVTTINNLSDLEALVTSRPDLVFLGMEYIPTNSVLGLNDPNKIWISDCLDDNQIAYTGSGKTAHELVRNKALAKQSVMDAKFRTSNFSVIEQNQTLTINDIKLDFPLFIKPTNRGGGLGVDSESVVYNFDQLRTKVHSITTKLHSDALIEKYLSGREFSIAILKDEHTSNYSTMPLELIAPADENGARLLSNKVKSSNSEQAIAVTDEAIRSKVTALALDVFFVLNGRDYGRIDIRLDESGNPYFLEANFIPSLISGYGSFPKACVLNIGLEYEPMILKITKLGLAHKVHAIVDEEPIVSTRIFPSIEVALKPV